MDIIVLYQISIIIRLQWDHEHTKLNIKCKILYMFTKFMLRRYIFAFFGQISKEFTEILIAVADFTAFFQSNTKTKRIWQNKLILKWYKMIISNFLFCVYPVIRVISIFSYIKKYLPGGILFVKSGSMKISKLLLVLLK